MRQWAIRDYFNRNLTSNWGTAKRYDGGAPPWWDMRTNVATTNGNSIYNMQAGANYGSMTMASGQYQGAYIHSDVEMGNCQVRAKLVVPTSSQTVMATGVCMVNNVTGATYEITWSSWNSQFRIRYWSMYPNFSGTVTQLGAITVNPTRGVYYWFEAENQGGRIRAKMWEASNIAPPTSWQLDVPISGGQNTNKGGVMAYAEHSTAQTFRVAQVQVRNISEANETTVTGVWDDFAEYGRYTLGSTNSGHEWHGDHAMSPDYYQKNRSSGNTVTQTFKGDSSNRAHVNRGVASDRIDSSHTDINYTNGSVLIAFMFPNASARLSLFMRHSGTNNAYGNNNLTGAFRVLVWPSTGYAYYVGSGATQYVMHTLGTAPQANVIYWLRIQIRNQYGYAKIWVDGQAEPEEWTKMGYLDPGAINAFGKSGFQTENFASGGTTYYLYHYESSAATWVNKIRTTVQARSLKMTMNAPAPRRRRRVNATPRALGMSLTSYPVRSKIGLFSGSFDYTSIANSVRRLNLVSHLWIGGTYTKIEYVPNIDHKMLLNYTPLRTRNGKVTRDIKSTGSFQGRRVKKTTFTRPIKFIGSAIPMLIPNVTVTLQSKYQMSYYSVISKGGTTNRNIKFTLGTSSVVALQDRAEGNLRMLLDAQIPGFYVVRAFGNISNSLSADNIKMKYADVVETSFTTGLNAEGFVKKIHFGTLDTSINFGLTANTAVGMVNKSDTNTVSTGILALGIRSYLNVFSAGMSSGYTLDRPTFDADYKELIERRASFIHYACTYHSRADLTIQYKHQRTMDRSSITYFIAYDKVSKEPLLYGASVNMWEDDMIIIDMSDNVADDLVQTVREQFELDIDKSYSTPRFIKRPNQLLLVPRIPEKPFLQRSYHQYMDGTPPPPDIDYIEADFSVMTDEDNLEKTGAVRVVTIEE